MDLSAFNLQGKVALITGGAHGIGFSIAEGMAKCGATICFNCSSEASLEKGLAAYKAAGIDAHGYVADVSDEDAVNAMVAKIKAEVGPVDILVNNAGLMKRVPMIEMSHADFMRVIDVHVGGAFNCSKAVLPDMMEKREGKIINICSMMSCADDIYYFSRGYLTSTRHLHPQSGVDCVVTVFGTGFPIETAQKLGARILEEAPQETRFLYAGNIQAILPLLEQSTITDVRIEDATVADELMTY